MIDTFAIAVDGVGFKQSWLATLGLGQFDIEIIVDPVIPPIRIDPPYIVGAGKLGKKKQPTGKITIRITYNGETKETQWFMKHSRAIIVAKYLEKTFRKILIVASWMKGKKITIRSTIHDRT